MLEIERRFLIALPLTWYAKFKLLSCKRIAIRQIYLKDAIDGIVKSSHTRVRCEEHSFVGSGTLTRYTQTAKHFVSPGINEEIEFELTQNQYIDKLHDYDATRRTIYKTRYKLPFKGKIYELDIYKSDLDGLAILEVELNQLDEPICLPPFFTVVKEITGEKEYSNYELASITNEELLKLANLISP